MIVADNDVISYFWLDASRTNAARTARERDRDWCSPALWKSEFRNVLYQHIRHRGLPLDEAIQIARRAERDTQHYTLSVDSGDVLQLVAETKHSAYDCEYVALAQRLGVPLVTGDKRLPALFPDTAVLLEDFARQ